MACIAAVVLVDGFQRLEDEFFTKALAFGCVTSNFQTLPV